ncbi:hypothetical protein FACS1894216_19290 [Synergistales bacterium]|nr:hypothetical protein FACS1894216_19290 [Synergistales bacterium]
MKQQNLENILDRLIKTTSTENPLKCSFDNNTRYYQDFRILCSNLCEKTSERQISELLERKFLLGKPKYHEETFLQSASELSVIGYVLEKYGITFEYEPQYNGRRNPECSFKDYDTTVNVEVKCPVIARDNNLIELVGRVPLKDGASFAQLYSDNSALKKNNDNKIKDYLQSAQLKFPVSDDTNFNILVICVSEYSDMDAWYGYLFNDTFSSKHENVSGVFTADSFVPTEEFSSVDAVVLSNVTKAHSSGNTELNLWDMSDSFSLCFLKLSIKPESKTCRYWEEHMLNFLYAKTSEFFDYQRALDSGFHAIKETYHSGDIVMQLN